MLEVEMSESVTPEGRSEPGYVVLRSRDTLHHTEVYRLGDVVIRETGPWAPTVLSLLRQPGPWTLEGVTAIGQMLRELHEATASYRLPTDAVWGPWFGRDIGGSDRVIGHCDVAPWNIVARDGLPVALIDWDFSGPVDPLVELAQAS